MTNMEDIEIVESQTNIEDRSVILECLTKNNGDVVKTIMELSELKTSKPKECSIPSSKFQLQMQAMREIVDEKDNLFHEVFSNMRNQPQPNNENNEDT